MRFAVIGLNDNRISDCYDQHTSPTLKKFVHFRAFVVKKYAGITVSTGVVVAERMFS